jgi:hypothetical protein
MLPGLPCGIVSSEQRFWPARLRWRLRGAWMWPSFVVLTLLDGLLLHLLPPVRLGVTREGMTLAFGIIVATFGNLVLVGAMAPWLTRRLAARSVAPTATGPIQREVLQDRVGTALLIAGVAGVLAAGLGSREVVVRETGSTERNAEAVKSYVLHSGDPKLIRNLDSADTIRLGEGYYRTCLLRGERARYFCLFVDTKRKPARVVRDPSAEPNSTYRP